MTRTHGIFCSTALLCAAITAAAGETGPSFGNNTPLAFEPNRGQWAEPTSFGTHAKGFSATFHGPDVEYSLNAGGRHARVAAHWLGAAKKTLTPADQLPGTANYYLGNDEYHWISGLPTYRRLKAKAIYPGIDLIYYGDHQQLNVWYLIGKQGHAGLALGKYNRHRELIIDPTISWSRTLGSGFNGSGQANAVAVDSSGNVLVAGTTSASDCPLTAGAYKSTLACYIASDTFVSKFSPDRTTMIFSTYYGGANNYQPALHPGPGLAMRWNQDLPNFFWP